MLFVRSDYYVCPNPLSADTHHTCLYDCRYCFVKMNPIFNRKPRDMHSVLKSQLKRFSKFKNHLPVIVARKSEALHPDLINQSIEYMKTLKEAGFKVILETKNIVPSSKLFDCVDGVLISRIPGDESLLRKLEPDLSPPDERFEFAKELSASGIWVGFIAEPLFPGINTDPKTIDEYLYNVADTGAKVVNFGSLRVNNPPMMYKRLKSIGIDLLSVISHQKTHWKEIGLKFFEIGHHYGLKITSPDWVNFGFLNDTEGCCGLDEFGVHHMTFQYALRLLKSRGEVTFSDVARRNLFTPSYAEKFRKIWNGDGLHYTLSDVEGVYPAGVDEKGNKIYRYNGGE